MRRREKRAEVLLLAAVSGEIPADWMGEAAGSKEYGAALLTRLKRDGAVKLRSKDGIGRMWSCFFLVLGQRTI